MKDKRNYLKYGGICGIVYCILLFIKTLFIDKTSNNDQLIAFAFFKIIDIIFSIILIIESRKDIKTLKTKKIVVIISSIWLFLDLIIPGILGFLFLSSLKKKEKLTLPEIDFEKSNRINCLKYCLLITFFLVIKLVLPFFIKLTFNISLILYIMIFIITMLVMYKDIKKDFVIFKNNRKVYFKFIVKRYLFMLLTLIIASIPVLLFNNGNQSGNQLELNKMFAKSPLFVFLLTTLYAPLIEELIFRVSLKKIINNKYIFVIISGVLFGFLHVIDDFKSISDILYIIQYSALGICLAKAYYDSKNMFISISMHFIQNFISVLLMLFLLLLK